MRQLIFFCLLSAVSSGYAESMYTLDLKKDIIIGFVSLGIAATSLFIHNSVNGVSKNNFFPSRDGKNAFNSNLMYEYNKPLDIVSDILLYGLFAMPVISLAGNFTDGYAWVTYGVMFAESVLLVFGTTELLKNLITRYRPFCYFGDVPAGLEADYYKSFPSRHTAFAFMSAGFLTSTFFTEYPDSPWKIPVAAVSYSMAAVVGMTRIFSGNHFISDILAGAALGTVYGYLVPWMHLMKKLNTVPLVPLYNGFTLVSIFGLNLEADLSP